MRPALALELRDIDELGGFYRNDYHGYIPSYCIEKCTYFVMEMTGNLSRKKNVSTSHQKGTLPDPLLVAIIRRYCHTSENPYRN